MQYTIDQRSQLIYGIEYGHDNTEQGRMRDVKTLTCVNSQYICSVCYLTETKLNPFVQYANQVRNDITVQAGFRYENFEIEVPDYLRYKRGVLTAKTGTALKSNELLFNLGAVYNFEKNTEGFINFS